MTRSLLLALLSTSVLVGQTPAFDTVIRHGTVIDGSGNPRFDADIGIRNGFIVAIGDLSAATATQEIEAKGLFVTPGFINIHSHASPDALATAVNMLTQGVTTEIFNADDGRGDSRTMRSRLNPVAEIQRPRRKQFGRRIVPEHLVKVGPGRRDL